MKKLLSLCMTAVLLTVALASCNEKVAETTVGTTASTTTAATTNPDPAPVDPSVGEDGVNDYNGIYYCLVDRAGDWSYKLFSMTYTGEDGDRKNPPTFDPETDTMAQYMAEHNWTMGAEKLPQTVLDDVANWQTSVGPFGDNGSYNEADIGFAGDNHGLMISTTFEIKDLGELLNDFKKIKLYSHYDNNVSIYINGTLVYRHDIAETNTIDWTNKYEDLGSYFFRTGVNAYYIGDAQLRELLVEGENTIFAMVKDAWGGRQLVVGMECA